MNYYLYICMYPPPFQVVRSGNLLVDGAATPERLPEVMQRVGARGFGHVASASPPPKGSPLILSRADYAAMFGPTVRHPKIKQKEPPDTGGGRVFSLDATSGLLATTSASALTLIIGSALSFRGASCMI